MKNKNVKIGAIIIVLILAIIVSGGDVYKRQMQYHIPI